MRFCWSLVVAAATVLLAGCNQIEHRSESLPKKSLPTLSQASPFQPRVLWSSSQGSGSSGKDAKLNLSITQNTVVSADSKGVLRAQNRNSGQEIWSVKTQSLISSGPTVIHNIILLGTRDARVLAYRLEDGALLWQVPVSGEVLAAPQGNHQVAYVNTLDGSIVALSLEDGRQLWRYSHQMPSIVLRKNSSPVIEANHVIAGFPNGRLLALQSRDGSVDWEHELSAPKGRSDIQRMTDISADPIVSNGVVYAVGYQGRLAALSLSTGEPLWEKDFSSYAGLSASDNVLFVSGSDGHICAVAKRSGETLWDQAVLEGRQLTKPVIWGDLFVVGDNDGYLHWFSKANGQYLTRVQLDGKGIDTAPILQDNALYALGKGGKIAVYTLDALSTQIAGAKGE
jgi:outer membrane protein assembly factor BamB